MILSKEQNDELREAAKPLVKFLNENVGHPHVQVIVDVCGAELLEGIATVEIKEFERD